MSLSFKGGQGVPLTLNHSRNIKNKVEPHSVTGDNDEREAVLLLKQPPFARAVFSLTIALQES